MSANQELMHGDWRCSTCGCRRILKHSDKLYGWWACVNPLCPELDKEHAGLTTGQMIQTSFITVEEVTRQNQGGPV